MPVGAKVAIWVLVILLVIGLVSFLIWWLVWGRKLKEKLAFLNSRVKVLELENQIQVTRAKQKENQGKIDQNDEAIGEIDKQIKSLEEDQAKTLKVVEGMSANDLLKAFKERGY